MKMTKIAMLLATWGSVQVAAQTLDDVVISASRAQQRSFDAPAAIESVERETIQDAGPQVNLSESLNRVPGLTILNRQNYAQDLQISTRGFGARATFGIRGVRLLIDGIPATTPDGQGQGSSIALTSTDRIEVLRGPLALLYGNSSGGVIQAWTRDAPDVPELSVQAYVGSYGLQRTGWQYAGRIGATLGDADPSQGVGLVADYSTFSTDGFRDNSATERKQFNGKLTFGPDAGTRVNVVFNHFDMPLAEDPLGLNATELAANPTLAGSNAVQRKTRKITSQNQLGSSVVHELNKDSSVTARAYFGTRDNLQYLVAGTTGSWVGLDRHYYGVGFQYNSLARIAGTPVRWTAGYEYDLSKERRQGGAATNGEKSGSLTRDEDNQALNSDVFAQGTALLSERWSLIAGVRRSTVRLSSQDYFINGSDPDGSGAIRYAATNPVLGLTWHAADTLNLYANFGKGFETPTLAEVAYVDTGAATPQATFNTSIAAARSRQYEIGAKWVPQPGTRVDVAVFQINTVDEIVTSRTNGSSAFVNAPGTQRRGVEFGGRTLLSPQWRAMVSASMIEAEFTKAYSTSVASVAAGNRLPGIPQHFVFTELLWSSLGFASVPRRNAAGTQAGLELVSAGRLYARDDNSESADGYNVFNLKASQGWTLGKVNLTAYARVDNVGDKAYVGSVIVNQTFRRFYEPAPGRNWTLGARLNLPL